MLRPVVIRYISKQRCQMLPPMTLQAILFSFDGKEPFNFAHRICPIGSCIHITSLAIREVQLRLSSSLGAILLCYCEQLCCQRDLYSHSIVAYPTTIALEYRLVAPDSTFEDHLKGSQSR